MRFIVLAILVCVLVAVLTFALYGFPRCNYGAVLQDHMATSPCIIPREIA